jgi:hypothetical protein
MKRRETPDIATAPAATNEDDPISELAAACKLPVGSIALTGAADTGNGEQIRAPALMNF